MQPQGVIVREYTYYLDYKYTFKVTFKGMHSGTNPSQVTGEVVESGKFTITSDTLKFYKERLTAWETGFPSSDRTYNGKSLSEKLKYKILNEKLELEYCGPGPQMSRWYQLLSIQSVTSAGAITPNARFFHIS